MGNLPEHLNIRSGAVVAGGTKLKPGPELARPVDAVSPDGSRCANLVVSQHKLWDGPSKDGRRDQRQQHTPFGRLGVKS